MTDECHFATMFQELSRMEADTRTPQCQRTSPHPFSVQTLTDDSDNRPTGSVFSSTLRTPSLKKLRCLSSMWRSSGKRNETCNGTSYIPRRPCRPFIPHPRYSEIRAELKIKATQEAAASEQQVVGELDTELSAAPIRPLDTLKERRVLKLQVPSDQ